MLTDYTTFDEIRAILSVTDEELEDDHLALPLFMVEMDEKFRELSPDILPLYQTYHAAGASTLTADQLRFYNLTRMAAAYAVAIHLLDSYDMLAVQTVKDARAEFARFEKPFDRIGPAVRATWAKAKARLLAAYNLVAATPVGVSTPVRSFTTFAGIASDPVTGQ